MKEGESTGIITRDEQPPAIEGGGLCLETAGEG